MTYADGTDICVGDSVLFEKQRTAGTIVAVIADELADWNVAEPGVMIKSAPFGLVFIPAAALASFGLTLEERAKPGRRWSGP